MTLWNGIVCIRGQVLSGGAIPFHWLDPSAVKAMRLMGGRRGLLGLHTLEAAAADDVAVEWRVSGASQSQLDALVGVMAGCLSAEPRDRPGLTDIQSQLQRVLGAGKAPTSIGNTATRR